MGKTEDTSKSSYVEYLNIFPKTKCCPNRPKKGESKMDLLNEDHEGHHAKNASCSNYRDIKVK